MQDRCLGMAIARHSYMKKYQCWIVIMGLSLSPALMAAHKDKKHHDDDKKHQEHHEDHEDKKDKDDRDSWRTAWITSGDQQVVREYILVHQKKTKTKGLPPGLAKKLARGGELPPGWQKKLVRGEVMPITVYQEVQPVPEAILGKMSPPPAGTRLGVIDGKVVRLAEASRTIVDVFDPF